MSFTYLSLSSGRLKSSGSYIVSSFSYTGFSKLQEERPNTYLQFGHSVWYVAIGLCICSHQFLVVGSLMMIGLILLIFL